MLELIVLTAAGLLAGVLNALAGGGTFITFPALVWIGVPPVSANATATATAMPGYASGAWAFRNDISREGTLGPRPMTAIAVIGGLAGAGLLMVTPGETFVGIVPWLLLVATLLFAFAPRLVPMLAGGDQVGPLPSAVMILVVSVYGGYFNGGLGILLLAAFSLMGFVNLHGMNGLKNAMSLLLSVVSVTAYTLGGLIAWDRALVLAVATTLGAYAGARLSRRIRNLAALKTFIVAVGAVMTVIFFLK